MRTAACYIRVSTDGQLEYSPDSQLSAIRRYAEANGLMLPEEFVFVEQDGISGRNAMKRPAFQRMITAAKQHPKPFGVILVWKFSRFARSREDSIIYKSMLRNRLGIEVVSVSENLGDDKTSVILEAMIEAMDEYYSINLAEEVRRGMAEKARRGEVFSTPPFGYIIEHGKLLPDPERAEIIRAVFEQFAAGASVADIVKRLTELGVRTRRGNPVECRTVEYWLSNPAYIGCIRKLPPRGDSSAPLITKGIHEPITDEALWNRVQERMRAQKARYTRYSRSPDNGACAVSGLFRCAACGHTLARCGRGCMRCVGYAHGTCSESQTMSIAALEAILTDILRRDLGGCSFTLGEMQARDCTQSGIIESRLGKLQKKLERARCAYLDGCDTTEEYAATKREIEAEIEHLNAELAKEKTAHQPAQAGRIPTDFCTETAELLTNEALSEKDKNAALKSIIRKVVLDKREMRVTVYYR